MSRQAREMARRVAHQPLWAVVSFFLSSSAPCGALTSERKCGVHSVSMPSRSGVRDRTHVKRLWSAWAGRWSTWSRAGSTKGETALSLQGTLCGGLTAPSWRLDWLEPRAPAAAGPPPSGKKMRERAQARLAPPGSGARAPRFDRPLEVLPAPLRLRARLVARCRVGGQASGWPGRTRFFCGRNLV